MLLPRLIPETSRAWARYTVAMLALGSTQALADGHDGGAADASAKRVGAVCIGTVEPPTSGAKSLGDPAGGNRVKHYSIRVDQRAEVPTSDKRAVGPVILTLKEKHLIRVTGDGKRTASFWFEFESYRTNELCLSFDPLYVTWGLQDLKAVGKWCRCSPQVP